ncbi:MAG: FISUMP domain-containing protein, partial [Deltaproteobacteria bacterium]
MQSLITPTLTGNSTACPGVGAAFSTDPGMIPASYQWSVTPDGTITPGASPHIVSVTWLTTGAKTISITYTDPQGCTTIPKSMNVTVNSLPIPTIVTGDLNVCATTQTYSYSYPYTTQNGMSSYSWNVSPGNTITFANNTASITWNIISPNEWIDVNYVDGNGCTAVTPTRTIVNVNPSPFFSMTGPQSICAGSTSVAYSLPAGQLGNWSLSSGGSITTPVTNVNSVLVNWTPSNVLTQATLTVNYSNTLGCLGSTPKTIDIQPLPVTSFTAVTPSPVCQDSPTPSLYTVDPGGPAATYLWQVTPTANASIADPTANPASIIWRLGGSIPQTAQLSLTATTSATTPACSSTSSSPMTVTINPKPAVSITPCFDLETSRSAKPFLLKGGIPLLTSTALQGEYMISPPTTALYADASGNYYFNPALVPGNSTTSFNISYKYTSSQYGCTATSPTTVGLTVHALNPACGTSMIDYRDNTIYNTADFNGKCWMTQNLKYGAPLSPTTPQSDNCSVEKYCLTTDPNCTTYGGLYQWDELIQYGATAGPAYQGVCPPGWHIPTQTEWQDLIDG